MFQLQDDRSRYIAICYRGSGAIMNRRSSKAWCANCESRRDRHATAFAPVSCQKVELPPATGTQRQRVRNDDATARTPWGQREIDHARDQRPYHFSLVAAAAARHKTCVTVPQIFDRNARLQQLVRAARCSRTDMWLIARASEDIAERFAAIRRKSASILLLSPAADLIRPHLPAAAHVAIADYRQLAEDSVAYEPHCFDCIISVGLLDRVNDLPGVLSLYRRALAPDGVVLIALAGAGSLTALRKAMTKISAARAHFHPQIDVRAMGDLMLRAGFSQPVVDADSVEARYSDLNGLVRDLRANLQSSALIGRSALTRNDAAQLALAFAAHADAGKVTETFVTLHATGWASAAQ